MIAAADPFEMPDARPVWLTTLADLSLLLLGFFVLVMATEGQDRTRLAAGMRAAFGVETEGTAPVRPAPMPLETARVRGFVAGDDGIPDAGMAIADWARAAAADPRVTLTLSGGATGGEDVDPDTGSIAVLAQARALAVAQALVAARAVRPEQLRIAAHDGQPAREAQVIVTIGFAGTTAGAAR
ncbi:flagellar motor protein MotB [Sphingomonas sp. FW199]|uniref:flagellar motor protein MotB n=1 Tax=Sphingomonas sp. FW199 TaxID=3400217 RepID=UPI003CE94D2B